MSYQAMKRPGGDLNAYYYVKEVNLKRLRGMISTTWNSTKDKTPETVKVSAVAGVGVREDE